MNVHEYQAANVLASFGIPVNGGKVADTPAEAKSIAQTIGSAVAVKAQVHTGGRGKAGGIKLAKTPQEAEDAAQKILGMAINGRVVHKVLVVPAVDIQREIYLGIILDRAQRQVSLMASAEGGVDIETVARETPDKIVRVLADPFLGLQAWQAREVGFSLGLDAKQVGQFADIAVKLFTAFLKTDATLAEINPLIVTGEGKVMALDSKMSFDDNAVFRHPDILELRDLAEEEPTEIDAKASGISFVKLTGNIGCIVNGAGLAMATMDAVKLSGGDPANFLDVGGGASADQVAKAFRLVTADPAVQAILINIFGGITRGDVVAHGIRDALGQVAVKVPIVVRLSGTNATEGQAILAEAGITAVDSMDEAAREVVDAVGKAA
ncbi:MAG TPA: ADP-forming succinate--CoA ligase subunit beta [Thermomicrobiales bacterium]|nr:ADP-forming succinate--CoA ligase subunit beta [Thermomicrobiales bacterium]